MVNSPLRRSNLKTVMATITLALSSQGLQAESLDVGIAAYKEEQFPKALEIFQHHATKGDPAAQYYLSILYRLGLGVELDEDAAFLWCKQAAEEGKLDAQYQLGIMYLQGEGVEEDDALALEWLWQAADRGHFQAKEVLQFTLDNDFTTGC
jgi:TPR repeat protein